MPAAAAAPTSTAAPQIRSAACSRRRYGADRSPTGSPCADRNASTSTDGSPLSPRRHSTRATSRRGEPHDATVDGGSSLNVINREWTTGSTVLIRRAGSPYLWPQPARSRIVRLAIVRNCSPVIDHTLEDGYATHIPHTTQSSARSTHM